MRLDRQKDTKRAAIDQQAEGYKTASTYGQEDTNECRPVGRMISIGGGRSADTNILTGGDRREGGYRRAAR